MKKYLLILLTLTIINISQAQAQLSHNPWLEPNDKEAIAEVLKKKRLTKSNNNAELHYEGNDTLEFDDYGSTIPVAKQKKFSLSNFIKSIKGTNSTPPQVVPEKAENTAKQEPQTPSSSDTPSFDFDKLANAPTKMINNAQSFGNTLYNKFNNKIIGTVKSLEKASGVNLKNIGRKI